MKKVLSLLFTLILILAFPLTLSAGDDITLVLNDRETINIEKDTSYQYIQLSAQSNLTIASDKTLSLFDGGSMGLLRGRITLKKGAALIGNNITINYPPSALIKMEKGARIDITFNSNQDATAFGGLLYGSGIEFARYGNRIVTPCPHENIALRNVCLDCGHIYPEDNPAVGTIISNGNLTLVVGVLCSVVFLAVGFFLGRNKSSV